MESCEENVFISREKVNAQKFNNRNMFTCFTAKTDLVHQLKYSTLTGFFLKTNLSEISKLLIYYSTTVIELLLSFCYYAQTHTHTHTHVCIYILHLHCTSGYYNKLYRQRKITRVLQNSDLTQHIFTDSALFISINSSPYNKEQQCDIISVFCILSP